MLFVVPYPPKTLNVRAESNTSLAVQLDYGYSPSEARCSVFELTVSPSSVKRQEPCTANSVILSKLNSNTLYQVSVFTVAEYTDMKVESRSKTVKSWTRKCFYLAASIAYSVGDD